MAITRFEYFLGLILLLVCLLLPLERAIAQESGSTGIWMSQEEINQIPTSGAAWFSLYLHALSITNDPDLANQNDQTDTNTMAKALVYARTGNPTYANEVLYTLQRVVELNPISRSLEWDSLAALRSIGSYAIAADLIDLKSYAPDFDREHFRPWLDRARFADTEGGRGSVASLQEKRPNNWGTHGSASRIAASLYLDDRVDLYKAAVVFRGFLGDTGVYDGFQFGDDLSWNNTQSSPTGINPKGSRIDGVNVDGAMPDEARRCGSFSSSFCKTGYMWEGLQGVVAAAEMLHQAGYPAFEWSDQAILRSVQWLYNSTFSDGNNYAAEGDDVWQLYIINKRYGTNFPTGPSKTARPGKMIGFTDWTHAPAVEPNPTPNPEPSPNPVPGPEPTPAPAELSLLSSKFYSSTGNLALRLRNAVPGAAITVTDDRGNAIAFGTAPINGSTFSLKEQFYTPSRSCTYTVTDGSARIVFEAKGSSKYQCGSRG